MEQNTTQTDQIVRFALAGSVDGGRERLWCLREQLRQQQRVTNLNNNT